MVRSGWGEDELDLISDEDMARDADTPLGWAPRSRMTVTVSSSSKVCVSPTGQPTWSTQAGGTDVGEEQGPANSRGAKQPRGPKTDQFQETRRIRARGFLGSLGRFVLWRASGRSSGEESRLRTARLAMPNSPKHDRPTLQGAPARGHTRPSVRMPVCRNSVVWQGRG